MRVQFSVDDMQWNKLEELSKKAGYPDVPSYCKDVVLEDRTYGNLWKTVVDKISRMEKDTVFALRDLTDILTVNLAVKQFEHQNTFVI